jgi:hypothetical protein
MKTVKLEVYKIDELIEEYQKEAIYFLRDNHYGHDQYNPTDQEIIDDYTDREEYFEYDGSYYGLVPETINPRNLK